MKLLVHYLTFSCGFLFQDGFWKVDDLSVIGIDTDTFIDMLKNAGARSLGKFHCAKTLALKEKKYISCP